MPSALLGDAQISLGTFALISKKSAGLKKEERGGEIGRERGKRGIRREREGGV